MWLQAWRDQRKFRKHVDERRRTVWHRVKWATLSFKCIAKENFSSQNLIRDQKRLEFTERVQTSPRGKRFSAPVTEIVLFKSKISLCSMSKSKLCSTVGLPPVELFCSWLMSCSALRRELVWGVSLCPFPYLLSLCQLLNSFYHFDVRICWIFCIFRENMNGTFIYKTCQHYARVFWKKCLGIARWLHFESCNTFVSGNRYFILFSFYFGKIEIYVGWS